MAQKTKQGKTKYPKGVVSWQEELKPLRNLVNAIDAMDQIKSAHDPKLVASLKAHAKAAIKALGTKEVKIPRRLAGRINRLV